MIQFLNPALLWGLAAASVPIIIHLLNRRRFRRQRWAAMEWLLTAAKKHQRRLQLESLLLLLLRTLAVLLLALALARPYLSEAPIALATTRKTHLFLVVDNSASTAARSGLRTAFENATSTAAALVGEIGSDDPVTLVVTNDNLDPQRPTGQPRVVVRESRDHEKVRRLLGELRPAPARADLSTTLKALDATLTSAEDVEKKVAILTDLQRTTFERATDVTGDPGTEDLGGEALRVALDALVKKGAEVLVMPSGRSVANVGVIGLRPEEDRDIVQGASAAFIAEIANFSDRPQRVEVRFLVDGEERGSSESFWVDLPPRPAGSASPSARSQRFSVRFGDDETGPHTVEARIPSDAFTFDDARTFAFGVRPPIKVLAVDGDPRPPADGAVRETYWLAPALALRDDGPITVTTIEESELLAMKALDGWDLVVLANVGRPAPNPAARETLEAYVRRGGALVLTVGDQVIPEVWNDELYRDGEGLLPARLLESRLREEAWLKLDLGENRHPILRDLTNPANAVFFQSPFLRGYMSVDEVDLASGANTVLAYTDLHKSPAMVERRFGKGRVLLLTTTVDDAWGNLPGSYLFPALLHETVYVMTARGNADRNLLAFQPFANTFPSNFDRFEMTYPDGSPAQPNVETPPDAPSFVTFRATTRLGAYDTTVHFKPADILAPAPSPKSDVFAVNLTPLESDLAQLTAPEIEARWSGLVTVAEDLGVAAETVRAHEGEVHRSLLILGLLCLIGEVLLARHIGTRRSRS